MESRKNIKMNGYVFINVWEDGLMDGWMHRSIPIFIDEWIDGCG